MGRCPPGVICIENMTLFFIIVLILCISIGVIYLSKNDSPTKIEYKNVIDLPNRNLSTGLFPKASYSYSNVENDVLLNQINKKILALKNELDALDTKYQKSKIDYEKIREKKEKISQKKTLVEEKEKLLDEIKILKNKISERQKSVEKQNKALQSFLNLESDIKSSEKRLQELDKKIEDLVKKIEQKRTLISSLNEDVKEITPCRDRKSPAETENVRRVGSSDDQVCGFWSFP